MLQKIQYRTRITKEMFMGNKVVYFFLALLLLPYYTLSAPTPTPPDKIYRKDSRAPSAIFREGFLPRGHNVNLLSHLRGISVWAQSGLEASGFISTTSDRNIARTFQPHLAGYIYEIIPPSSTYDALLSLQHAIEQLPEESDERASWEQTLRFSQGLNQQQWVITNRVRPQRIRGAYELIPNPQSPSEPQLGTFIPNPNFDQYAHSNASSAYYPVTNELPSYFAYVRSEMRNSLRSLAFSCLGVRGSNTRNTYQCPKPKIDIKYIDAYSPTLNLELVEIFNSNNFDFGNSNQIWKDINGDGLIDHCAIRSNQIVCMIQNENNEFNKISQHIGDLGWKNSRYWVDFNGDGITDYCRIINNWTKLQCNEGTESGYFKNAITSEYIDAGWVNTRRWANIDGGKMSFCRQVQQYGSEMAIRCISPSDNFRDSYMRDFTSGTARYDYGYAGTQIWGDINGDNQADFCFITGSSTYKLNCLITVGIIMKDFSQKNIFSATLDYWPQSFALIDINNDNKSDFCFTKNGKISCRINSGLSLLPSSPFIGNQLNAYLGTWGDINNDGLTDLCHRPNNQTISCFINGGNNLSHYSVSKSFAAINKASSGQFYYPIIESNVYCTADGTNNKCFTLNTPRVDSQCEILIYNRGNWVWQKDSTYTEKSICEKNNYCSQTGGTCRRWHYFK